MASTPAALPSLGLLDGLGIAVVGSTDTPAPLPSLALLNGLGNTPLPSNDRLQYEYQLPVAWFADPGFAGIYAWYQEGIPVSSRANVTEATASIGSPAPLPSLSLLFGAYGETGAVMHLKPRLIATAGVPFGSTGAVMYLSPRLISGVWTQAGVNDVVDQLDKRPWLPPARHPIGTIDRDGRIYVDAVWYRAFQYAWDVKMGGIAGPSIPDLAESIAEQQRVSIVAQQQVEGLSQQVQVNAGSLTVTIEVLRDNAIPGADAIPDPKTSPN